MGSHAPVLVCGNVYVVLTTLTSVLGKGCLHTAIGSRHSLFLLLYTFDSRHDYPIIHVHFGPANPFNFIVMYTYRIGNAR